eukprot:6291070-Ditylum_brightwellii.AAC.1
MMVPIAPRKKRMQMMGCSVYLVRGHNVSYILGKVLPLMIMGMALMRGEKALLVISKVLSGGTIQNYPSSWLGVALD